MRSFAQAISLKETMPSNVPSGADINGKVSARVIWHRSVAKRMGP
jgi:hypothetical protein